MRRICFEVEPPVALELSQLTDPEERLAALSRHFQQRLDPDQGGEVSQTAVHAEERAAVGELVRDDVTVQSDDSSPVRTNSTEYPVADTTDQGQLHEETPTGASPIANAGPTRHEALAVSTDTGTTRVPRHSAPEENTLEIFLDAPKSRSESSQFSAVSLREGQDSLASDNSGSSRAEVIESTDRFVARASGAETAAFRNGEVSGSDRRQGGRQRSRYKSTLPTIPEETQEPTGEIASQQGARSNSDAASLEEGGHARVRGLPAGYAFAGRLGTGGWIGNLPDVIDRVRDTLTSAVEQNGYPPEISDLAMARMDATRGAVGDQEWGAWLAQGGDRFTVRLPNGHTYTIEVKLAAARSEGGTHTAKASSDFALTETWDPEADLRVSYSRSKSSSWAASLSVAQTASPLPLLTITPSLVIGASGSRNRSDGELSIAVGRRNGPSGEIIWFTHPKARVEMTVKPHDSALTVKASSEPLSVTVGFPDSHVPWVDATPNSELPSLPTLGEPVTLQPESERTPENQARLDDIAWTYIRSPEAVDGLETLRDLVLERLPADAVEPGSDAWLQLRLFLSERNQIRLFPHLAGIGNASPTLSVGASSAGLSLQMHVLSVRRVHGAEIDTTFSDQQRHMALYSTSTSRDSGLSLSISPQAGMTIHDGKYGLGLGVQLPPKVSGQVSRGLDAAHGSTRWQRAETVGATVVYALGVRFVAHLRSDLPAATGDVASRGTVYVRIPLAEANEFETALRAVSSQEDHLALASPGAPGPESVPVPRAIRKMHGIGPSHVEMTGSVRAIQQQVLKLILEARQERGLPSLDSLQEHQLQRALAVDFSLDGLKSQGERLLSFHGLRRKIALPRGSSRSGIEATIVVRAHFDPESLLSTGVRENRSTLILRALATSLGHSETLSTSLQVGIDVAAKFGLSWITRNRIGALGLGGGYHQTWKFAETLSTGDFAFSAWRPRIDGPSRWFEYGARFEVIVTLDTHSIRHSRDSATPVPRSTSSVAPPPGARGRRGSELPAPRGATLAPPPSLLDPLSVPESRTMESSSAISPGRKALPSSMQSLTRESIPKVKTSIVHGGIRFWVPQSLLIAGPAVDSRSLIAEVGEKPSDFPPLGGREYLRPDDMLLAPAIPHTLAETLTTMLTDTQTEGFSNEELETMVAHLTDPDQILAYIQNGTGNGLTSMQSLQDYRRLGDLYLAARVRVELHRSESVGRDDVLAGRLDIVENTPTVTAGRQRSRVHATTGGLTLGINVSGKQSAQPGISGAYIRSKSSGTAVQHKATVGAMQSTNNVRHQHKFAHVVYTLEVERWRNTLFGAVKTQRRDFRRVRVPDGLEFLRPTPAPAPAESPGVDIPLTIDARHIMTLGLTRGLEFSRSQEGGQNPLIDLIIDLLRQHVPSVRKAMGRTGTGDLTIAAESRIVQELRQVLNPGSLVASVHRLTSTGLRLSPLGRDSEYYILLRGRPKGEFRHEGLHDGLAVGTYINSFDWTKEAKGESYSRSLTVGLGGDTASEGTRVDTVSGGFTYSRSSSHERSTQLLGGDTSFDLITFNPGTHLYSGVMELSVSIKRVVKPSPVVVNRLLGELPDRIKAAARHVEDPNIVVETRNIDLKQVVGLPSALTGPNGPVFNTGVPLVVQASQSEIDDTLRMQSFALHPDAMRHHKVLLNGIDDISVGEMYQKILEGMRASGRINLRFSGPELLAEIGADTEEALHDLLSSHFLGAFFSHTLTEGGYTSPELVRPGGVLTDNRGKLLVRAKLFNAEPLAWVRITHTLDDNKRVRQTSGVGQSSTREFSSSVGEVEAAQSQDHGFGLSTSESVHTSATINSIVGGGVQREYTDLPYLLVRTGVAYTLTLQAANERGIIQYGARGKTFHFLLHDAVQLLLHPDEVKNHLAEFVRVVPDTEGVWPAMTNTYADSQKENGAAEAWPKRTAGGGPAVMDSDQANVSVAGAVHSEFEAPSAEMTLSRGTDATKDVHVPDVRAVPLREWLEVPIGASLTEAALIQEGVFSEEARSALRYWSGAVAKEVADLEGRLIASGEGSRSLVMGARPGSPLWAINMAGVIRWFDNSANIVSAPQSSARAVASIDLDPHSRVLRASSPYPAQGSKAIRLCKLVLGAYLPGVLGL